MSNKKNIVVLGVGGVGGYFGGKLALASSSHGNGNSEFNVYYVARGDHLAEIRKHGLILNTVEEKRLLCRPTYATDSIAELPEPDICFICVKSYDLDALLQNLKEKVTKNSVIIPLLNGVDIYDRVTNIIESATILPACVYIATRVEKPGVVTQQGGNCTILFGTDPRNPEYDPRSLFSLLDSSSIKYKWHDDPFPEIWTKFLFIASLGMVTAFSQKTFGQILESPELTGYARSIMDEIYVIAVKKRIKLPPDIVAATLDKVRSFPYETMTSFQRDVQMNPDRHEGEILGGTVIRMGRELGVPTPITDTINQKFIIR